ncbi:MAG: S-layer family protein [Xenococcaceae cyanobacterium MO_188.B32]|nr:S-layer family protein [Xenococcaceae cyanobacterium MO_188.B32]
MIAPDSVKVIGTSADEQLASRLSTRTFGSGNAGDLNIFTGKLIVREEAVVATETYSSGQGGDLRVIASEAVEVIGTGSKPIEPTRLTTTLSIVGPITIGFVQIPQIIQKESQPTTRSALTSGTFLDAGNAGNITINTPHLTVKEAAQVLALTSNKGTAGNIEVTAKTLEVRDGGNLNTITKGSEKAGDITLIVLDSIILTGDENTGLLANTTSESSGDGGNIIIGNIIAPRTLIIQDGARVAVNSEGEGKGGDIEIFSGSLTLDNEAAISAETRSNLGGNITLQIDDDPLIFRRRNSLISATAGDEQFGGDGGNIIINAPFLIAYPSENNDIIANAFEGRGGKINITTNAIFGLEFRMQLTPLSDITAFSQQNPELNGVVEINTSGIDPTRGLLTLPEEPVNTEISQGCQTVRGREAVEYFDVGRGGSPVTPDEPLNADGALEDWIPLEPKSDNGSDSGTTIHSPHSAKTQFISPCPAQ